MVEKSIRDDIIKEGIYKGVKVDVINKKLQSYGLAPYNPLTYAPNYKNLGSNLATNARGMARDLSTIGGKALQDLVVRPTSDIYTGKKTVKQAFTDAVNKPYIKRALAGAAIGNRIGAAVGPIGRAGGTVGGALMGALGPEQYINAALSPYNITLQDIKNRNVDYRDVVQGAMNNPLYAGLDLAPVAGGASKALYKVPSIRKAVNATHNKAPLFVQQMLPSPELREVNRKLTEYGIESEAKNAKLNRNLDILNTKPLVDREQVVKYITTNKAKLNASDRALARAIKKDLITAKNEAVNRNLISKEDAETNAIAQYAMAHLIDRTPLLQKDITDIIQGNKLRSRAVDILSKDSTLSGDIAKLVTKGKKLYDEDKIAFLTQKIASERDPLGEILAKDINKDSKTYWDTSRVIGRTSAKRLGTFLDDSLKFQLDQMGMARQGDEVLNKVLNNPIVARDIVKEDIPTIKENFNNSIAKDIQQGKIPDLQNALKESGISTKLPSIYSTVLNNYFTKSKPSVYKKFQSSFKKAALGTPRWVIGNRVGNWINNAIEGVTNQDILDAFGKYKKYLPEKLKQQTSFNSYISRASEGTSKGLTETSGKWDTIKKPINSIFRSIGKFSAGDKSLRDIGKLATSLFSSTSDITANPIFKIEAGLEVMDRYANFVRQAKRYAKENKLNVEDVLKQATKDDDLYFTLNNEVNKSLGDYVGRNYAIPTGMYDVLSDLVPFYRFLTQTGRTTLHQAINRPVSFANTLTIPARVGNKYSAQAVRENNINPQEYKGGIPYYKDPVTGILRTYGYNSIPLGAVLNTIFNEPSGALTPLITTTDDIIHYRKFKNQTPTSPRLTKTQTDIGQYIDKSKYTPTPQERVLYGLNNVLNTTYNPYIWLKRYYPETAALLTKSGLQSDYDTNLLFGERNPMSYKRELPFELIGRWLGMDVGSTQQNKRPMSLKKRASGARYNVKKIQANSKSKIRKDK